MARFARVVQSMRPDLVYPWLEQSALLAAPLARLFGVPVLVARRNVSGPYVERPRPIVSAIHAAERLAVLATANSSAVAAETVRRGIPAQRVRVIANGYDPASSPPLPCQDVVVLGYVARMRPEKGHRRLLAALAALDSATPWRVDLAGDGPLEGEIEAEARRLGLDDKVRFLGAVDDVRGFWRGCDGALLLSDHEGSPNALIEAAGMGRPLLATGVGGIPEFVDEEIGILVSPDDAAGLVAALRRLIEDRVLRERLWSCRPPAGDQAVLDGAVRRRSLCRDPRGAGAIPLMSEDRFGFGENWRRFLDVLDDERIAEAERSLTDWLGDGSVRAQTFLDAGCGSGLFSLAAVRLGAQRVHSFDYDPASVGCALELRSRFGGEHNRWTIERGDVLDDAYISGLGTYDVVYSWGVLHHTGDMWRALRTIQRTVAPGGRLFIAIYNDQRMVSRYWTLVKRIFNRLPAGLRVPYAVALMAPRELASLAIQTLPGRPQDYVHSWTRYKATRGMSRWHDLLDWVGGYPFEVAKPEEIFELYHDQGFELERLRTCGGGLGCNEFLFERSQSPIRTSSGG